MLGRAPGVGLRGHSTSAEGQAQEPGATASQLKSLAATVPRGTPIAFTTAARPSLHSLVQKGPTHTHHRLGIRNRGLHLQTRQHFIRRRLRRNHAPIHPVGLNRIIQSPHIPLQLHPLRRLLRVRHRHHPHPSRRSHRTQQNQGLY